MVRKAIYAFHSACTDEYLDQILAVGITDIYLFSGMYTNTPSIEASATVDADIVTIRAKSGTFRVFAHVGSVKDVDEIDISTAAKRAAMVIVATNFLGAHNFDGYHDNMEGRLNGDSLYDADYLTYLNALHTAVNAAGKLSSAAVYYTQDSSLFYGNLTLDYINCSIHDGQPLNEALFKTCLPDILNHSAVQVIVGLIIPTEPGHATISTQLDWMEDLVVSDYATYEGYSVFHASASSTYEPDFYYSIALPSLQEQPPSITVIAGVTGAEILTYEKDFYHLEITAIGITTEPGEGEEEEEPTGPTNIDDIIDQMEDWGGGSANVTLGHLVLDEQHATTGHYIMSFDESIIRMAIFPRSAIKTYIPLGIFTRYSLIGFTGNFVNEGDYIIDSLSRKYVVVSVEPWLVLDQFYYYFCGLEKVPL